MTEAEWLTSGKPSKMFEEELKASSDRKQKLFAVACCRRVEHRFIDSTQHAALEVVELAADNLCLAEDLAQAGRAMSRFDAAYWDENLPGEEVCWHASCVIKQAVTTTPLQQLSIGGRIHWLDDIFLGTSGVSGHAIIEAAQASGKEYDESEYHLDLCRGEDAENRVLAELLREIFGNPFRPVSFDPAWWTSTALALAKGIYDDRAFDRLPILADALQEAGCDSDGILNHLRDATAPHVSGCWALDLVLGKG